MARRQIHFEGELCEECGERTKSCSGFLLDGTKKYRSRCGVCHRSRYLNPKYIRVLNPNYRNYDDVDDEELSTFMKFIKALIN